MRRSLIRCSQKSDKAFLADRVKEFLDIRIKNVVHLLTGDSDDQRIPRVVLAAFRPEGHHRALNDLVLQRGHGVFIVHLLQ
jgi:hypothetical protein